MKKWERNKLYLKRSIGKRGPPKPSILIVCEGAKTEPLYFEAFKISSVNVEVQGQGMNTDSLVQYAIDERSRTGPYDQVWCVFDRDSFPPHNFNRAIQLATSNDIKPIYTNEAFELWYLLHFYFYDTALSRDQYEEKLTQNLGFKYKKNDRNMYSHLAGKQANAIKNAQKLYNSYSQHNPETDNPSTMVHTLVTELNGHLDK